MIWKRVVLFPIIGAREYINKYSMEFENRFSHIAALLGDKCRSSMLWNLLDGRAYTATELSLCTDVSAQSASNHLSKLVDANILMVEKQGRHRYYRYANDEVAQVIESMANLVPLSQKNIRKEKTETAGVTYARTCYDHIAGKLGVTITNSLLKNGIIEEVSKKYEVSSSGNNWFRSIGINIDEIKLQKRSFAYPCLDWSERRHHLAGALGATLLQTMLHHDWIRRIKNSRELLLTSKGKMELGNKLNLEL
jgi:DNA-binding transcriptional ArsR family regulator